MKGKVPCPSVIIIYVSSDNIYLFRRNRPPEYLENGGVLGWVVESDSLGEIRVTIG